MGPLEVFVGGSRDKSFYQLEKRACASLGKDTLDNVFSLIIILKEKIDMVFNYGAVHTLHTSTYIY